MAEDILNIMSSDRAYGKVSESRVKDLEAEIQQLRAEKTEVNGLVQQIVAERDAVNKVLKDVLERLGRLEKQ